MREAAGPHLTRPSERVANVQLLRGVAALLVVVAHAIDLSEQRDGLWGIQRVGFVENAGAFGVDFFFVISGFVMAFSVAQRNGARDAGRFLELRWARIAPPYLVVTALLVVFDVLRHARVTAASVANAVLFLPVLDPGRYTEPPLSVGWTLSFEFAFYLLVAAMLVLHRGGRPLLLALVLIALVAVGALVPAGIGLLDWVTNPILLEFALGVAAYAAWSRGLLERFRPAGLLTGAAGAAAMILEIAVTGYGRVSESGHTEDGTASAERVLLWGFPAAAIFVGVLALPEADGRSLPGRALRVLGDLSYSLYLVHLPLFRILGIALGRSPVAVPGPVIVAVAVLAAVLCGVLYYRFVERPFTSAARRVIGRIAHRHATPSRR